MINSMILEGIPLPVPGNSDLRSDSPESLNGSEDFLPLMMNSLDPSQRDSFRGVKESPGNGIPTKEESQFYLESLRKALLANGKPLDRISIGKKDITLLKKFLFCCGYSKQEVERFFKGLTANQPGRGINLSRFFSKIDEFGPPKGKDLKPITLENSAIPHIEALLRDLGIEAKELAHLLSAAKSESGGLDLEKLLSKLKGLRNRAGDGSQVKIDNESFTKLFGRLEGIENQMHNGGSDGKITLKDFIASLEQMTGRHGEKDQIPTGVKETIAMIMEKVDTAQEKTRPVSSLKSFTRPEMNPVPPGEKTTEDKNQSQGEDTLASFKKRDLNHTNTGRQGTEIHAGEKRDADAKTDNKQAGSATLSRKAGLSSGLESSQKVRQAARPGGTHTDSGTKTNDVPQNISGTTFSETIQRVHQNSRQVQDLFPAYLIDQVGKQLSRSILRGDRVFRLQLKPPDLGILKVNMDIQGNVLKLGMLTENQSVRDLLMSSVHELREALSEQGVKIEKIDIQINHNFEDSLANSREGLKEGHGGNREAKESSSMEGEEIDSLLSAPQHRSTNNHLVDLVA